MVEAVRRATVGLHCLTLLPAPTLDLMQLPMTGVVEEEQSLGVNAALAAATTTAATNAAKIATLAMF